MGMKIDPTTCKPEEVWAIEIDSSESIGRRTDSGSDDPWITGNWGAWRADDEVTPLYRLVPELSDADTLRKAAAVMADLGWVSTGIELKKEADYLDSLAAKAALEELVVSAVEKALVDTAREFENALGVDLADLDAHGLAVAAVKAASGFLNPEEDQ